MVLLWIRRSERTLVDVLAPRRFGRPRLTSPGLIILPVRKDHMESARSWRSKHDENHTTAASLEWNHERKCILIDRRFWPLENCKLSAKSLIM